MTHDRTFTSRRRRPRAGVARVGATALGLIGALALPLPAGAAAVSLTVGNDDSAIVIRASTVVGGDSATAWKVLTDYGRYASFVPGLETSRVVARSGAEVTVEQTGVAPLWLLRVPLDVTYRITEYPPTHIVSHATLAGGATLDSDYRLTPEQGGIRLDYAGRLAVRSGTLASLREKAGEEAIAEHFRALAGEIEREAREPDRPARRHGVEAPG